jgi:hypothetical protein
LPVDAAECVDGSDDADGNGDGTSVGVRSTVPTGVKERPSDVCTFDDADGVDDGNDWCNAAYSAIDETGGVAGGGGGGGGSAAAGVAAIPVPGITFARVSGVDGAAVAPASMNGVAVALLENADGGGDTDTGAGVKARGYGNGEKDAADDDDDGGGDDDEENDGGKSVACK